MPSTIYLKCKQIMQEIKRAGFETQITWNDLVPIIRKTAGAHKVTVANYRRELQAFGFLKAINDYVFSIEEVKG